MSYIYYRLFRTYAESSPLIGGTFSNAAQKYPTWFGTTFFVTFPYFLPCFVVACVTLFSVVIGYFWLEEVSIPNVSIRSLLTSE